MRAVTPILAAATVLVACGCASSQRSTDTTESILKAQPRSPSSTRAGSLPVTGGLVTPATASNPVVEQYYPGESREHWVSLVLDRGARVRLEDDSVWEVAPQSRIQTMNWGVSEKI